MPAEYPKRPDYFAFRFCRLMAKVCLANEIGPAACWLLTVVVQTEDAKRYRGPVTFFNEQLFPLVGVGSVDALARLREKAVQAGWLHYAPGGKGRAGTYWALIPARYTGAEDTPVDEQPAEYRSVPATDENMPNDDYVRENAEVSAEESAETTARKVRRQPRGKCGDNREESAEHSSLPLSLSQDPPSPRRGVAGAGRGPEDDEDPSVPPFSEFIDAWAAAGLPPGRLQRTPNRVEWWQRRHRDDPLFRSRWREAVAHLGRQAKCRRPTGWAGVRPDLFLEKPDTIVKAFEGLYNDDPPAAPDPPVRDYIPPPGEVFGPMKVTKEAPRG